MHLQHRLGRSLQAEDLDPLGPKTRNADFGYPDGQLGPRANLLELARPIVERPMVPVQRKPMDGRGVEMFERAVAVEEREETGINGRDPDHNPGRVR
jgi:hypothetical protein